MRKIDSESINWLCGELNKESFKKEFRKRYNYEISDLKTYADERYEEDIKCEADFGLDSSEFYVEVKTIKRTFTEWKAYSESGSDKYVFLASTSAITYNELSGYTLPNEEEIIKHKGVIPDYIIGKKIYMLNASTKGSKRAGGDKCKWVKLHKTDSAVFYIFKDCIIYFDRDDLLKAFQCYAFTKPSNSYGGWELKAIIDLNVGFKYDCKMPESYFPDKNGYKR